MTQKELMLSGQEYNYKDEQLDAERLFAEDLVTQFNQAGPKEIERRSNILDKLLGAKKDNVFIKQPFYCDYGYNIKIGENFFSNFNFTILDESTVTIGDNVLVGPNVSIYTVNHAVNIAKRNAGIEYARPVSIGNNVWIGGNVVILQGVTIGDNSIVGAGSVVTKSIPANVLAAGNPCKVLREFSDEDLFGK
jgi:acetyltransferase-like isoleucine patch superfamily enzyme